MNIADWLIENTLALRNPPPKHDIYGLATQLLQSGGSKVLSLELSLQRVAR